MSREAGLAPTFVEMPDAHLERALLAVAAGVPDALANKHGIDRGLARRMAAEQDH